MNRIYRLVWNSCLQLWAAVAENAKGRGKGGAGRSVALALLALAAPGVYAANAADASVSAGMGSVATTTGSAGRTTTINQSSQRVAIDWLKLSTSAGEALVFKQPNTQAIALNRITGDSPSTLLGSLSANGQVFILNPNGVLFGATSQVNVGGLVASTLGMGNADFMAGGGSFTKDAGSSGSVVNQGRLSAGSGGYIALLAPEVRNEGVITASLGTVLLAAGNKVTLNFNNGSLLGYTIDQGAVKALAENGQLIQADGGQVLLAARAANNLASAAVNNTGVIEARTVGTKAGRILLLADMESGTVNVGGTLDAGAPNGGNGGFIETSGARVKVADGAKVSTLAASGKTGTWLIDPSDFTITSGSDVQTTSGIGATTLATDLASTNVTLATDNIGGGGAGDITVNAAVNWSTNTTLTLNAYNNINVNAAITATGASAGLVLNYGNYATAGSATSGTDYKVSAPITLSGANATLAINGTNYTLWHSMADLATATGNGAYALAQDLDASASGTYTAAVLGTLSGTLAGLGHAISNMTIASSRNNVGLIGTNNGVLRDIGLVGGSVSGSVYVGGLVGSNAGSIRNSYTSGAVTGNSTVGGLVGFNRYGGGITNSYASGAVSGSLSVGGLVGISRGAISDSYATGAVQGGYSQAGGLVGLNDNGGTINNSYASGLVTGVFQVGGLAGNNNGDIGNSYWDSASSGQSSATSGGSGTLTNVNAVNANSRYYPGGYANFGTWSEIASGSGVYVATDSSGPAWVMVQGATRPFLYSEYSTSIHNAHQLQLMAMNLHASYSLANDIDASATSGSNAGDMWSQAGFVPVGNPMQKFGGSLDGNDHNVSHLTIYLPGSARVGLFGASTSGSRFVNLHLVDVAVTGGNESVGALLGGGEFSVIRNASVTGTVTGSGGEVGGLVGFGIAGNISYSHSGATVVGGTDVGGLVGGFNGGSVDNSDASGTVMGGAIVGGLVGSINGSITDSHASGAVTGSGDNIGGLLGQLSPRGSVTNAYASGAVTGTGVNSSSIGGLVGDNQASIGNSYATGAVSGVNNIGGLAGGNNGSASSVGNSYATGSVTATGKEAGGLLGYNAGSVSTSHASGRVSASLLFSGGLVGVSYFTIDNSYASGTVTGNTSVGGLVGVTAGGSITESYASGAVTGSNLVGGLVGFNIGATISNSHASGPVTGDFNVGGLVGNNRAMVVGSYASGVVQGTNNYAGGLVGHNEDKATIATSYATGTVSGANNVGGLAGSNDGRGVTVSNSYATGNVSASGSTVGGLLGENGGGISASHASGTVMGDNNVGGLVGQNTGTISNSYATGNVSGANYVAGLVGDNQGGQISNSYASGTVTGSGAIGGLVGYSQAGATIGNSYAAGAVTGDDTVGGLVGNNEGAISNSYSTGRVTGNTLVGGLVADNSGTVSASFWNTETSGQAGSAGGTGISTAQMQTAATFANAGWDIATVGGSTSVWRIYEGYAAPLLRSFLTSLTATAGSGSKVDDGSTATSLGVAYSATPNANLLGTASVVASGTEPGTHGTTVTGLYSNQQGYDITAVDGSIAITAAVTAAVTTAAVTAAVTTAASAQPPALPNGVNDTLALTHVLQNNPVGAASPLSVQGCGVRLPAALVPVTCN